MLYNSEGELVEVTDKFDLPKNFNYISSGDITRGEMLLLSHERYLSTLSREDIAHVFYESESSEKAASTLNYILEKEFPQEQSFVILQKERKKGKSAPTLLEKWGYIFMKFMDNILVKRAWSYVLL